MSIGTIYLICAVLGALNTVNAYRPFSRAGRLSLLWFIAGMFTSELPLHVAGWQVLATIGFGFAGALRSATGVAGLAVSVVSWIVLVGLHRDAQRSRDVLERALRDGL